MLLLQFPLFDPYTHHVCALTDSEIRTINLQIGCQNSNDDITQKFNSFRLTFLHTSAQTSVTVGLVEVGLVEATTNVLEQILTNKYENFNGVCLEIDGITDVGAPNDDSTPDSLFHTSSSNDPNRRRRRIRQVLRNLQNYYDNSEGSIFTLSGEMTFFTNVIPPSEQITRDIIDSINDYQNRTAEFQLALRQDISDLIKIQSVDAEEQTLKPTAGPSSTPSLTLNPSATVSTAPSAVPNITPSATVSATPSVVPSITPSATVSETPSSVRSILPSFTVSETPSSVPSILPSVTVSETPSTVPNLAPSAIGTAPPSLVPSLAPSISTTAQPNVPSMLVPIMGATEPTISLLSTAPSYVPDLDVIGNPNGSEIVKLNVNGALNNAIIISASLGVVSLALLSILPLRRHFKNRREVEENNDNQHESNDASFVMSKNVVLNNDSTFHSDLEQHQLDITVMGVSISKDGLEHTEDKCINDTTYYEEKSSCPETEIPPSHKISPKTPSSPKQTFEQLTQSLPMPCHRMTFKERASKITKTDFEDDWDENLPYDWQPETMSQVKVVTPTRVINREEMLMTSSLACDDWVSPRIVTPKSQYWNKISYEASFDGDWVSQKNITANRRHEADIISHVSSPTDSSLFMADSSRDVESLAHTATSFYTSKSSSKSEQIKSSSKQLPNINLNADGAFPRFVMGIDGENKGTFTTENHENRERRSSNASSSYFSGIHPLDWSNGDASTMEGSSIISNSEMSDLEGKAILEQYLANEQRRKLRQENGLMNKMFAAAPVHDGGGGASFVTGVSSTTSEQSSLHGSENSQGSTSTPRGQLINDLIWLKEKIAHQSNPYTGSYSSDVEKNVHANTVTQSVICRDCYASPGNLHIVICSSKGGPIVCSVGPESSLEGQLFSDDVIIAVDNMDTRNMTAEEVIDILRSKNDSKTKLTVLHFGA